MAAGYRAPAGRPWHTPCATMGRVCRGISVSPVDLPSAARGLPAPRPAPSRVTTLTHSRHVLYGLVFWRVPFLYRKTPPHHLGKPALPALRPLRVMLPNDGRAIAQHLGHVL